MSTHANDEMDKASTSEDVLIKTEKVKIRCNECDLPFWTHDQLKKHSATHTRRKKLMCSHCTKRFSRSDHLKMHMRSCDKNKSKYNRNNVGRQFTTKVLQVGRGLKGEFKHFRSAFNGAFQEWRYDFPENKGLYENLGEIITKDAHELVSKAAGLFKWYLSLEVVFNKPTDPGVFTKPPVYFTTDPVASYHTYSDDVWEIVKEQLEKQIDNYETNGSGWVVFQLISLTITFTEMENPLERSVSINDDEDDE